MTGLPARQQNRGENHEKEMAEVLQFDGSEGQAETPLTPELKQFIDRVVVPSLIKLYLSERNEGPKLAGRGPDVGESSRNTAVLQGQEGP
jgi:hypothetical protein